MADHPSPWHRSDLTPIGHVRALVVLGPRRTSLERTGGAYALTGPDGFPRAGLSLAEVIGRCAEIGIAAPVAADLEWLEGVDRG